LEQWRRRKQGVFRRYRIADAAAVIIILAVCSRLLGFVREAVIAAYFGAGALTDAYQVALLVPAMLFTVFGGQALGTVFIPVFTGLLVQEERERALRLAGGLLILVFMVLLAASLAGIIFAPALVKLVAPGFSETTAGMAVCFSRFLLAGLIFFGVSGFLSALLNAYGHFTVPAAAGIFLNLSIITFICLSGVRWGIAGLIAGTVAGYLVQVVVQIPPLISRGFRFYPVLDFKESSLRQVGRLMWPVMAIGAVTQVGPVVTRVLASSMPPGSITALNYADRVLQLPLGLFMAAFLTASYPALSAQTSLCDLPGLKKFITDWLGLLFFLTVPAVAALVILRVSLIEMLFQRGAFDAAATRITAEALLGYAPGLPFLAAGRFLARVFYALQDSLTPMLIGVVVIVLNVVLSVVMVRFLALGGLALAASLSAAVSMLVLFTVLSGRIGPLGGFALLGRCLKMALAGVPAWAVMAGAVSWFGFGYGLAERLVSLALAAGTGVAVYFLVCRWLGLPEVSLVFSRCGDFLARR